MYLSITGVTPDNKLAKYQSFELEADAVAHALEYGGFSILDPEGAQEFWVIDMAAKTVVQDTVTQTTVTAERAMASLRAERDRLLAATDDRFLSDAPAGRGSQAWLTYRQALRDLPANTDDPDDPTWPTQPE